MLINSFQQITQFHGVSNVHAHWRPSFHKVVCSAVSIKGHPFITRTLLIFMMTDLSLEDQRHLDFNSLGCKYSRRVSDPEKPNYLIGYIFSDMHHICFKICE